MKKSIMMGPVREDLFLVPRVEQHHHAWPAGGDGADQRAEVEDLLVRVERDGREVLALRIVDRQIERGEPAARRAVALVDQLDAVLVARLVERRREQGRQVT